eukprot:10802134-Alexandrium_andersonii.AAC.1
MPFQRKHGCAGGQGDRAQGSLARWHSCGLLPTAPDQAMGSGDATGVESRGSAAPARPRTCSALH